MINRRLYGQHKLWKSARRAEIVRGRDQVARLMGLASINGVRRGKRSTVTTRRDETAPRHPDHIKRAWATPTRPDQWWVADFTYVWTLAGFVYVSFITDVYSRRILGWRVMTFKATPLVLSALEQAVFTRRRHSAQGGFEFTTTGPVHHSDAGSQGEIKWSSQHLEHGGVACRQQSWSRKVVVGSRPRIGRSGRGCAPRVGHRPPGRPSAARD
ncbi:MAG: DDE-type integrase/transposase/recombinase [Actinobacteria bacterium]|nr:DDE-type integrase/transposase/recombinase [Actinomycetota bacterium]